MQVLQCAGQNFGCRPASIPSVVLESCSTADPWYVENGDRNTNGKIYRNRMISETAELTSDPELELNDEQG